jgi:apolipoprotein N-acyltransferase
MNRLPVQLALAMLAGALQALALGSPLSDGLPLWWLQLGSLAILAALLDRQVDFAAGSLAFRPACDFSGANGPLISPGNPAARPWRACAVGLVFASTWLAGTFWWLFISMHTYGGLAAPLAGLAVLALAGTLALYYAVGTAVYFMIFVAIPSAKRSFRALVFASLWTLAELARGQFFTGFPWGAGGYAHVEGLLSGYAPWVGVYGVGAVAAWVASTAPRLLDCGPWPRLSLLLVLTWPTVAAVPGTPTGTHSAGRMTVELLQGNIAQNEKFQARTGIADALNWYGSALKAASAELVVAPETALPMLFVNLSNIAWFGDTVAIDQHLAISRMRAPRWPTVAPPRATSAGSAVPPAGRSRTRPAAVPTARRDGVDQVQVGAQAGRDAPAVGQAQVAGIAAGQQLHRAAPACSARRRAAHPVREHEGGENWRHTPCPRGRRRRSGPTARAGATASGAPRRGCRRCS